MEKIDIKGLDKAKVLKALHDNTRPLGYGTLHARDNVSVEEFTNLIERLSAANNGVRTTLYFDYVYGRPIKCEIGGDEFDPKLYDRDAGEGAAVKAISTIR